MHPEEPSGEEQTNTQSVIEPQGIDALEVGAGASAEGRNAFTKVLRVPEERTAVLGDQSYETSVMDKDAQEVLAIHESVTEGDEREQLEFTEAQERSTLEAGLLPLSSDGVVRSRLSRHAQCEEVQTVLRCSTDLAYLRGIVDEAGCELKPAWAGGMWLFVPLTREQFLEAGMAPSRIHILARSNDEHVLRRALDTVLKEKMPQLRVENASKRDLPQVTEDAASVDVEGQSSCANDHIVIENTFYNL